MSATLPSMPSRSLQSIALLLLGVFLHSATLLPVAAQEDEEAEKTFNFLETEHALSMDFVTPHTAWARPYAQGKTRVLFFAPWFQGSTEGREIIELMQRFDLDAQAVWWEGSRFIGDGRAEWYGGDAEAGTKRVRRLLDQSQQVFFINQLSWKALPDWLRQDIDARVRKGAGLVFVGGSDVPALEGATPAPAPPTAAGSFFALDAGRVAVLPSREKLLFGLGWETRLDYQLEQQGAVLLWAAGSSPGLHLELRVQDMARTALPQEITLNTAGEAPEGMEIEAGLCSWDGQKIPLGTHPLQQSLSLSLPMLRAGEYHLNAFARNTDGVVAWATTPFTVSSALEIDGVVLLKDWAEVGERVEGYVAAPGTSSNKERIELRLVDTFGRVLAVHAAHRKGNKAPFSFRVESWMPMLLRVEAALVDKHGDIDADHAFLRVTRRNRDQFNFVVWNTPGGDLAPYGVQSMTQRGATVFLQGGPPPPYLSAYGAAFIPYAASFRVNSHTLTGMLDGDTGYLKGGCVHDDAAMNEAVARVVEASGEARKLGVFAYSLGDENAVRASCLSPHCLKAYQEYLQRQYENISALNRSWGTDYSSFESIALLAQEALPSPDAPQWFKEYFAERTALHATDSEGAKGDALQRQLDFGDINDEMRALQQGNFARWYDRQAFQSYSYLEWCRRYREAFRQIDPQAWTGFEGTDSFTLRRLTTRSRQGGDLDAFVRETDYYGSYVGPGNEVLRSIAPPMFPRGSWMGYTADTEKMLREYWEQVTDGMNTIQWWRWDNLSGYCGFIAPSFSSFPSTQELFDDTQIVRDGLGTLLMQCEMQDDGLAMLYSMPSTHIAHFDGNETYGLYKRDHDQWHKDIHSAGLQFRYVTDRMLRQGEFQADKYKVLLLPLAFAIGEQEAKVIKEFVASGGTVIADLRPGLYDGHCKPYDQGLLNDLFGIKRTGNREARAIDRLSVDTELNGHALKWRWGNWQGKDIYPAMKIDPSVELTTGKALGQAFQEHYWAGLNAPILIQNDFGKGRAILLNFSIFEAPFAKLLPELLAACGVEPSVSLKAPTGAPVKNVETTRWMDGEIQLVSFLGDYEGKAQVQLPREYEVYDLRTHEYLGRTRQFQHTLNKNRAAFFALFPEAPSAPELKLKQKPRLGQPSEVSVSVPEAQGLHALKLSLEDPSGKAVPWYRQHSMADDKNTVLTLPFACNDPAGTWKLLVTDVLTGHSTSETLDLK